MYFCLFQTVLLIAYLEPLPVRRDGDDTAPLVLLVGHRLHTRGLGRGEEAQHTSAAELVTTDKKYLILGQDQPALVCFEIHIELISTRTTKQASQASKPSKQAKQSRAKQANKTSKQAKLESVALSRAS